MDVTQVWHTNAASRDRPEVERALAEVDIRETSGAEGTGPTIVFFDEPSATLLDRVRRISRDGRVRVFGVALSESGLRREDAFRVRSAGASDVAAWKDGREVVSRIRARLERWAQVDAVLGSALVTKNLVGRSAAWISLLRQTIEAAKFADSSVLLIGESGTGKELLARLMHTLDRRPDRRDLVVLDCSTVVPELSGSEFFGHEKGAFTGATSARDGAFALADGGTLFLDEVGELPLPLQAQLLRVVQERTYKRVGANTWHRTSFRLLLATNRDVADDVMRGAFRRDFFHRVAMWTCRVPPLRERVEDIPLLVEHFLRELRPDNPPGMDETVQTYLCQRAYPGNVRELRHLVARMVCRHSGVGPLTVGDIPEDELPEDNAPPGWPDPLLERSIRRALDQGVSLEDIRRVAADRAIAMAVDDEEGNLQRAAQRLGCTDRALQARRARDRDKVEG